MKAFSRQYLLIFIPVLTSSIATLVVLTLWLSAGNRDKRITAFKSTVASQLEQALQSSEAILAGNSGAMQTLSIALKRLQQIGNDLSGDSSSDAELPVTGAEGKILAKAAMMESLKASESAEQGDEQLAVQLLAMSSAFKGLVQHIVQHHATERASLRTFSWLTLLLVVVVVLYSAVMTMRYQREAASHLSSIATSMENERSRTARLTAFIEAMASGNYDMHVADKDDELSTTLVSMRDKLKRNAEEEQRRSWANTGLAKISEILRESGDSAVLFDNIIKFVVKYTQSNQGGLFLLNDTDPQHHYLELAACYAFERKKYLNKKVDVGEGLVGECFLERESIHLIEVPEDYVQITSGLGGDKPSALLLMPLKVNDTIVGVLELASFKDYPEHAISLVQKFAENIASTVSGVKVNDTTRKLLAQTQEQTEAMRAQEEEMRQNMEELSATQEQMMRQMKESDLLKEQLRQREQVFGLTTILSEADTFGTIIHLNDKLVEVSKYSREELMGKGHNIFRHPDMPKQLFKLFWDTIQQGQVFQGIIKNRAKDGTHYWVDATVVPVKDEQGRIIKYVSARYHITNDRIAEDLYEKQARRLGLPLLQTA